MEPSIHAGNTSINQAAPAPVSRRNTTSRLCTNGHSDSLRLSAAADKLSNQLLHRVWKLFEKSSPRRIQLTCTSQATTRQRTRTVRTARRTMSGFPCTDNASQRCLLSSCTDGEIARRVHIRPRTYEYQNHGVRKNNPCLQLLSAIGRDAMLPSSPSGISVSCFQ